MRLLPDQNLSFKITKGIKDLFPDTRHLSDLNLNAIIEFLRKKYDLIYFFLEKKVTKIQGEKPTPTLLSRKKPSQYRLKNCSSLLFALPAALLPMYALVNIVSASLYQKKFSCLTIIKFLLSAQNAYLEIN